MVRLNRSLIIDTNLNDYLMIIEKHA